MENHCALSDLYIGYEDTCYAMYIQRTNTMRDKSLVRFSEDYYDFALTSLTQNWVPASLPFQVQWTSGFLDEKINCLPDHPIKKWFQEQQIKQQNPKTKERHTVLNSHSIPYGVLLFHKEVIDSSFSILPKEFKKWEKEFGKDIDISYLNSEYDDMKCSRRLKLFMIATHFTSLGGSTCNRLILENVLKGIPTKKIKNFINEIELLKKILNLYIYLQRPLDNSYSFLGSYYDDALKFRAEFYKNNLKIHNRISEEIQKQMEEEDRLYE